MKWRRTSGEGQVEDRRGAGYGRGMAIPMGALAGSGGVGTILLVLLLVFGNVLGGGRTSPLDAPLNDLPAIREVDSESATPDPDADLAAFVTFVVDHVQDSWRANFEEAGREYPETVLVLFEGATPTGCGTGHSATGPFYCPADSKVYLDLGFFRELHTRFGAPGDFAQAYVIAHEFGHHVQNAVGISDDVRRVQERDPGRANELSVRLELQADCLAGVWAHAADQQQLLEVGDMEEGLAAAAAVGDDRLQRQSGRGVDPESWTHGSSAQRTKWFRVGYTSGNTDNCDTFATG